MKRQRRAARGEDARQRRNADPSTPLCATRIGSPESAALRMTGLWVGADGRRARHTKRDPSHPSRQGAMGLRMTTRGSSVRKGNGCRAESPALHCQAKQGLIGPQVAAVRAARGENGDCGDMATCRSFDSALRDPGLVARTRCTQDDKIAGWRGRQAGATHEER